MNSLPQGLQACLRRLDDAGWLGVVVALTFGARTAPIPPEGVEEAIALLKEAQARRG